MVLRGKFIAINTLNTRTISSQQLHLQFKELEKEHTKDKTSGRKEMIKIREEINETENRTIEKNQ